MRASEGGEKLTVAGKSATAGTIISPEGTSSPYRATFKMSALRVKWVKWRKYRQKRHLERCASVNYLCMLSINEYDKSYTIRQCRTEYVVKFRPSAIDPKVVWWKKSGV
jgi:hypothetical protein